MAEQYAKISEGFCPLGHGPLRRDGEAGWCEECGHGWSARSGAVAVHICAVESEETARALAGLAESLNALTQQIGDAQQEDR